MLPPQGLRELPLAPEESDIKVATRTLTPIREDERGDPACPCLLGPLNEKWQLCSLRAVKNQRHKALRAFKARAQNKCLNRRKERERMGAREERTERYQRGVRK